MSPSYIQECMIKRSQQAVSATLT